MTEFSRLRFNLWKPKNFSLAPRSTTFTSRFYRTCEKVSSIVVVGDSAGVIGIECDITGGLNDNAPTGESRHIRVGCSRDDVVISIVAPNVFKYNKSVECYV
jgi:hypothetical protein